MKIAASSAVIISVLLFASTAFASGNFFCRPDRSNCKRGGGKSSSAPAHPSNSSRISVNPSAVPVERGFGIETIIFKDQWDVGLVSGTGRIGAAISPGGAEGSFYGPIAFELDSDYLARRIERRKFASQKVNLATAFSLFANGKNGLKRFDLNLGVGGKYHRLTKNVTPGGGLSGIAGPLTFGYSVARDEWLADEGLEPTSYYTEIISGGIYLTSFAIDYSIMRTFAEDREDPVDVRLLSSSVFVGQFILSAALRKEESDRLVYDPATKTLVVQRAKSEMFFGGQVHATKNLLFGIYHNYYQLREISVGFTLFF